MVRLGKTTLAVLKDEARRDAVIELLAAGDVTPRTPNRPHRSIPLYLTESGWSGAPISLHGEGRGGGGGGG